MASISVLGMEKAESLLFRIQRGLQNETKETYLQEDTITGIYDAHVIPYAARVEDHHFNSLGKGLPKALLANTCVHRTSLQPGM